MIFGVFIIISSLAIFPNESSWGSIYSVFGAIISLIGISKFTKRLDYLKRLIINFGYFILFVAILFIVDYIGAVNIHQAPRFCLKKVSMDTIIYYDAPFYDVIRCNVNEKNESFNIVEYSLDDLDNYCLNK